MILPLILIIEKEHEVSELLKDNLFFEGYDFVRINQTENIRNNIYHLLPEVIVVDEKSFSEAIPTVKIYLSGVRLQTRLLTYNSYYKNFAEQEVYAVSNSHESQYCIDDLKNLVKRVVSLN
jgi:DNA-binding NtrC family response regulator